MPTYEYACKACGHHLEVVQSFKDSALTECPNCGGPLRKVFGNIGITFKGSGFYKTDSRSDRKTAGASAKSETGKSDTPTSTDTKASDAKSTDTKVKSSEGSSSSGSSSSGSGSSGSGSSGSGSSATAVA
ncbi:MAG TPA: FmdB family zinc ribbon protein [Acidimicrobiales bacterium]|nr:FmdB family zinc ribbon protein [Acidimicrobiales bacterium]